MLSGKKFGTFGGVFTPSILTILGVIMFLRLPWIVGQAGLPLTILIVVVAHIISFSTGLSVASIATDKRVGAGGSYFIISRSLGLSIGGTLGIALFIGISFSISLYLIGFAESFLPYWGIPATINHIRLTGAIALLVVVILTMISTSLAMKTQYLIMGAIMLALATILPGPDSVSTTPAMSSAANASFALLFGIFFPAVTGFEAGVSMSGDLNDPKKSIPFGTMSAILVGFLVYVTLSCFFAWFVDAKTLREDSEILTRLSLFSPLLMAGIWGATISSALGGILGAPRILQAMSNDQITFRFFAKGHGSQNEPRRALILTALIALAGILIGELDVIAGIVSMFFITAYGFINIVSGVESWVSPDFRPAFRVPRWISIVGALTCLVVMIQLDFLGFLGATMVMILLFLFLKRRELKLESGDVWEAVWSSIVRRGLLQLNRSQIHQRNWRPNVILFSGDASARPGLLALAQSLIDRRGIITSFELVETSKPKERNRQEGEIGTESLTEIPHRSIETNDIYEEMLQITSHYGFAGFDPNTVMLGHTHRKKNAKRFVELIQSFNSMKYNIILADGHHNKVQAEENLVDIWWTGQGNNFTLAVSLVRFLQQSDRFRDAKTRFIILMNDPIREERIRRRLVAILEDYRLEAMAVVKYQVKTHEFTTTILKESKKSRLVILGLPDFKRGKMEVTLHQMNEIASGLQQVLWISASEFFKAHTIVETQSIESSTQNPDTLVLPLPEHQKLQSHLKELHTLLLEEEFKLSDISQAQLSLLEEFNSGLHALNLVVGNAKSISLKNKKAFIKESSEVLFTLRAAIESYASFLERNGNDIASILLSKTDRLNDLIKTLPKFILLDRPYEFFQSARNDSFLARNYKFFKRSSVLFRKKTILQKLKWRSNVEYYFHETYLSAINSIIETFYREQNTFMMAIDGLFKSLERLFIIPGENLTPAKIINEVIQQTENNQSHLITTISDLQSLEKNYLSQLINLLGLDLQNRMTGSQKTRSKKKKNQLARIQNNSQALKANVRILATHFELEARLLFERNRLHWLIDKRIQENNKDGLLNISQTIKQLTHLINKSAPIKEYKNIELSTEATNNQQIPLTREIHDFLMELPEHISLLSLSSLENLDSGQTVLLENNDFSLRRYLDSILDMKLTETLRRYKIDFDTKIYLKINQIREEIQKIQTNSLIPADESDESESVLLNAIPSREKCITMQKQLQKIENEVSKINTEFLEQINTELAKLFKHMHPLRLISEQEQLNDIVLSMARHRYSVGLQKFIDYSKSIFMKIAEKVIFKRSEAIMLAGQLQKTDTNKHISPALINLKKKLEIDDTKISLFSEYYRRLFPGKMAYQASLWHQSEEQKIGQRLATTDTKGPSLLCISGPRNSGKSWLSRHLADAHFNRFQIFQIFPDRENLTTDSWANSLKNTFTGITPGALPVLPANSVLIVNDLELFWERHQEGHKFISQILEWFQQQKNTSQVILNMNSYFRRFISKLVPLEDLLTASIEMKALSAENLASLILLRQKTCGLEIRLKHKPGEPMSALKQAHLFHRMFELSMGRPGVALQAWTMGLEYPLDNSVVLSKIALPDFDVLYQLPVDWMILLTQFVLHKTLGEPNIQNIMGADIRWLHVFENLERTGLITGKNNVFEIQTLVQPHLESMLLKKGYL